MLGPLRFRFQLLKLHGNNYINNELRQNLEV